jgi:hypothetical protein
MRRGNILCVIAILAWLPYAASLWPLPPAQAADLVQTSKQQLADLERKSTSAKDHHPELEKLLRQFVEEADEWKMVFWAQWIGRLSIVVLGIAAWTLPMIKGLRWWPVVVASTAVLWLSQAVFHASTYSYFLSAWTAGYSGFRFLPTSVVATLYFEFLLPLILLACTAVAIRWRSGANTGAYRTSAL